MTHNKRTRHATSAGFVRLVFVVQSLKDVAILDTNPIIYCICFCIAGLPKTTVYCALGQNQCGKTIRKTKGNNSPFHGPYTQQDHHRMAEPVSLGLFLHTLRGTVLYTHVLQLCSHPSIMVFVDKFLFCPSAQ